MLFNQDSCKPVQEVRFSRKNNIEVRSTISLNNVQAQRVPYQKHLGILINKKLNFKQLIDSAILKVNKGISLIKKLTYNLPRKSLVTIYKAFLKPLIDYGDIIYDQPQNESFCEKIETVQCKAILAITSAIQGASRDKVYKVLGLVSHTSRKWYKRLVCMLKMMNEKSPNYLINLILKYEPTIGTRNSSIRSYKCGTNCFKYSFFPSDLNCWFELDINTRNSESIPLFKCRLLSFIRPVQNNIYNIFNSKGLKFASV